MTTISDFLAPDHQRCDTLFAVAETAVAGKNWDEASAAFDAFRTALLHHFAMEEEVMFPAFEEQTGMTQGPTQIMRMEHRQMMELLDFMSDALAGRDGEGFLGNADTLLIIMQQHNLKEEQMLYRMADQALSGQDQLIARMEAVQ